MTELFDTPVHTRMTTVVHTVPADAPLDIV
jgi:hypothetical protein